MLKPNLLFLFVAVGVSTAKSQDCSMQNIEIICKKIQKEETDVEKVLACEVDPSMTSTIFESSVSSIVHSNGSEVVNLTQIQGLGIFNVTVKYIPTNIGTKFPNLKALIIRSSELLSVNKESLKDLGNSLEFLFLAENNIASISADTLKYNSALKVIDFSNNPIRHIDPAFFTNFINMKSIRWISLEKTDCIDQNYSSTNGDIAAFKWENEKCKDEAARALTQKLTDEATCDAFSNSAN